MWVKYTVTDFLVFFVTFFFLFRQLTYRPAIRNGVRILTYDGSKDVVWRKDVPFECPEVLQLTFRGSKSPKTAPVGKSQPKRKRLIMLNNFVNRRNTPIIVINH